MVAFFCLNPELVMFGKHNRVPVAAFTRVIEN